MIPKVHDDEGNGEGGNREMEREIGEGEDGRRRWMM